MVISIASGCMPSEVVSVILSRAHQREHRERTPRQCGAVEAQGSARLSMPFNLNECSGPAAGQL